jgi:hypothetical protein
MVCATSVTWFSGSSVFITPGRYFSDEPKTGSRRPCATRSFNDSISRLAGSAYGRCSAGSWLIEVGNRSRWSPVRGSADRCKVPAISPGRRFPLVSPSPFSRWCAGFGVHRGLTERNDAVSGIGGWHLVACPLRPDYGRQRYIMIFALASSSTKTRYSPSARLWARTA